MSKLPEIKPTGETSYGQPTRTRADITCPKTGEPIPLGRMSICKFGERSYFVYCPDCRAFHGMVVAK
jgi:hypothetical protein